MEEPNQERSNNTSQDPVKITATTVIGTTPPPGSEILTAIGVVTDLGSRDTVMLSSSPNSLHTRIHFPWMPPIPPYIPPGSGASTASGYPALYKLQLQGMPLQERGTY